MIDREKSKKTVEDFVLTYFPLHHLLLPEVFFHHKAKIEFNKGVFEKLANFFIC